jgi:hypothetical protein
MSEQDKLGVLDQKYRIFGSSDISIRNDSQIKVNNVDAWRIDSTSVGGRMNESDIYLFGSDKAFVVTYLGQNSLYSKYSSVVQEMLDSITLN